MQQGIGNHSKKKLCSPQHPRNLDPPLLTCYLPAEAFPFWHLTMGRDAERSFSGGNMKKTSLLLLFLATTGWAQTAADIASVEAPQGTSPTTSSFPGERIQSPTYSDLYCSGFISKQTLPDANYVSGGLQTPSTTKFTRGDMVYLQGAGYTAGAEYEIVRALRDVNEYEMFPGQHKLLKETGQPYEEVGRIKIIDTRSHTAIAQIEYACDGVNPGDTTIPFVEKQSVTFHAPVRFDRYMPSNSKTS